MKRGLILAIGMVAVLTAAADARAQGRGRGGAPACTTVQCDVLGDWGRGYELLIGVAEAMPEDKFGFKPTPAQQTFGERVLHVVTTDLGILQALGGKTPVPMVNTKAATKAELLAALKQSFDYGDAVIKEFTDQQWVERVAPPPFMGPSASRARIIYFDMQHSNDMYGQFVVYLRLNGGTPPASRPRNAPPEP